MKAMTICQVTIFGKNKRIVATGKKDGLLWEFLDATDLKRSPLYYPEKKVKVIYEGNASAPDIDKNMGFKL